MILLPPFPYDPLPLPSPEAMVWFVIGAGCVLLLSILSALYKDYREKKYLRTMFAQLERDCKEDRELKRPKHGKKSAKLPKATRAKNPKKRS